MDKSALLFDNEATLKVSRVRSCTAIVIAALLVAGAIAVALIIRSDHRVTTMCPTSELGQDGRSSNRIMDTDVRPGTPRDEAGETASEALTYNSALNTVLLNSPGNFSVGSAATIAIDFDRSVVVMSFHEDQTCLVFALQEQTAETIKALVRNDQQHQVINIVSDTAMTMYDVVGEIPDGYFQNSNGPIIRGLCSGRPAQWMAVKANSGHDLQKRGCSVQCGYFGGVWGCRVVCRF
ncbi:uncharacterized protein [Diadema antillarum]|uniref:uncharacterized protein n=2 Tax=Diadema antillarum TaxID=105358 RepID=UPI003A85BEA8